MLSNLLFYTYASETHPLNIIFELSIKEFYSEYCLFDPKGWTIHKAFSAQHHESTDVSSLLFQENIVPEIDENNNLVIHFSRGVFDKDCHLSLSKPIQPQSKEWLYFINLPLESLEKTEERKRQWEERELWYDKSQSSLNEDYLKRAVELRHPYAIYQYSDKLINEDLSASILKAIELLLSLQNQKDENVQYLLSCAYKKTKNQEKYFTYLQAAAENNHAQALCEIGDIYYNGKLGAVERDLDKSLSYLKRALSMDYLGAEVLLSHVYQDLGNFEEAVKLLERAADRNDEKAIYRLGFIYFTGEKCEKNFEKSLQYFQKISNKNNDAFINIIKIHLEGGFGVKQDLNKVYSSLEKILQKTLSDTQQKDMQNIYTYLLEKEEKYSLTKSILGFMLYNEIGCKKNINQAVKYLTEAALQYDIMSLLLLVKIYKKEPNECEGVFSEIFQKYDSAEKDSHNHHPYFLLCLGFLYSEGLGGAEQDIEKALKFFEKTLLETVVIDVKKYLAFLDRFFGSYELCNIFAQEKRLKVLELTLKYRKKIFGDMHPEVSANLSNLGAAYGSIGNNLKQKDLLEAAKDIQKAHYGENHTETAKSYANLANALGALGQFVLQKNYLEKALEVDIRILGRNHPDVARIMTSLAKAYGQLGLQEQRKDMLVGALMILDTIFLRDTDLIKLPTLFNLGDVYNGLHDNANAQQIFKRAIDLVDLIKGSSNMDMARALAFYASALEGQEKIDILLKAKEIEYKIMGYSPSATLSNLAIGYKQIQNFDLALKFIKESLESEKKLIKSGKSLMKDFLYILNFIAELHNEKKDYNLTKELFQNEENSEILKNNKTEPFGKIKQLLLLSAANIELGFIDDGKINYKEARDISAASRSLQGNLISEFEIKYGQGVGSKYQLTF